MILVKAYTWFRKNRRFMFLSIQKSVIWNVDIWHWRKSSQSVIRIVQHQTTKFLADDDETFKVVHKTYSVISQTKEGIWGFKCF